MSFFLAGDEGFEPPNVGTKSRCLTTWRIPSTELLLIRGKNLIILPYFGQNVRKCDQKFARVGHRNTQGRCEGEFSVPKLENLGIVGSIMAMLHKRAKNPAGFTLVELIIVIVVIGILASITIVGFGRFQTEATDARRASSATSIAEAIEKYYDTNGEYPGCQAMKAADITNTTLRGLEASTVLVPKAQAGTASSIKCGNEGNILDIDGADFFEYTGDDSTDCNTGASCLGFNLRYKEEGSESVKSIASRRHATFAIGDITLSTSAVTFTSFNAAWTPLQNVTNYSVQRATNSAFTSGVIDLSTTGTSTTISGLAKGTTYYVRVKANNSLGQSTDWSNVATVTTTDVGRPTITSIAQTSTTKLTPTWSASANATSYRVDYSTVSTFTAGSTNTTTVTGTSAATPAALQQGRLYYFRVTALNGIYASTASATVTQTTLITAPSAPVMATAQNSYSAPSYTTTWTWTPGSTCPANTTMMYRYQYTMNTGTGITSSWMSLYETASAFISTREGYTYVLSAQASCRSNSTTTLYSSWSASANRTYLQPLTAPTGISWTAGRIGSGGSAGVSMAPAFSCRTGAFEYGNFDPYIGSGWLWTSGPNSGNSGWYTPGGFIQSNMWYPGGAVGGSASSPYANGAYFNARAYIACRNVETNLQSSGSTITGPGWTWGTNI